MKKLTKLMLLFIIQLPTVYLQAQPIKQQLIAMTYYKYDTTGILLNKDSTIFINNTNRYTWTRNDIGDQILSIDFKTNILDIYSLGIGVSVYQNIYADTTYTYQNSDPIRKRASYRIYNSKNQPTFEKAFNLSTGAEYATGYFQYYPDDSTINILNSEYTDEFGDITNIYYKQHNTSIPDSFNVKENTVTREKYKANFLPGNEKISNLFMVYSYGEIDSMYLKRIYNSSGLYLRDSVAYFKYLLDAYYPDNKFIREYLYNPSGKVDTINLWEFMLPGGYVNLVKMHTINYNSAGKQIQAKIFTKNDDNVLELYDQKSVSYADDKIVIVNNPSINGSSSSKTYYYYDADGRLVKKIDLSNEDTSSIYQYYYNTYNNLSKVEANLNRWNEKSTTYYYYKNIPTAIDNQWAEGKIMCYPNPTKDIYYIDNNYSECDVQLSIYDINGRAVHQEDLVHGTNKIDISRITNGIYLVHITEVKNSRTMVHKLIIK